MSASTPADGEVSLRAWLGFGVAAILLTTAVYAWSVKKWAGDASGSFGDMFGGLNTVFSGFAFLGLIVAILLQKKELKEQREELSLARKAHQETSRTMLAQHDAAQRLACIQGLNFLLVVEREKLETLSDPATVAEDRLARRTRARLNGLEKEMKVLVMREGGAAI